MKNTSTISKIFYGSQRKKEKEDIYFTNEKKQKVHQPINEITLCL
jgi:hypothetical protein